MIINASSPGKKFDLRTHCRKLILVAEDGPQAELLAAFYLRFAKVEMTRRQRLLLKTFGVGPPTVLVEKPARKEPKP